MSLQLFEKTSCDKLGVNKRSQITECKSPLRGRAPRAKLGSAQAGQYEQRMVFPDVSVFVRETHNKRGRQSHVANYIFSPTFLLFLILTHQASDHFSITSSLPPQHSCRAAFHQLLFSAPAFIVFLKIYLVMSYEPDLKSSVRVSVAFDPMPRRWFMEFNHALAQASPAVAHIDKDLFIFSMPRSHSE